MPLHIPAKLIKNTLLLSIQVAATAAAVSRLMNVGGAAAAAAAAAAATMLLSIAPYLRLS